MLYQVALDQSEYVLPKELYLNALFFQTAAAMGLKNIRIKRQTKTGDKLIIPSYIGISFAPAGAGKDHSKNLTEDIFKPLHESFNRAAEMFFDAHRGTPTEPERRYLKLNSYFIPVESSEEGIQKAAQTICDMGIGSVNIQTDELGDNIGKMEQIFKKIKTAWDTGTSEGPINVSDSGQNYFTVKNTCFNALLFGSPAKFELRPDRKEKLIDAYVSGMARRSFIYHNDVYRKSENKNREFEYMSDEDYVKYIEFKKDIRYFINNTTVINYPQEVWQALRDYDEVKELKREKSHSLIACDLGAPKKIEKLLGIIATLDLSDTITMQHLEYAIQFTEAVDATAEDTVEFKPIYIQIYNELLKRDFSARTDIVKAVKDVTLTSLANEMVLVEEYANMLGNSIIKKENNNIVRWKLEQLSKTDLSVVIISRSSSTSKTDPSGFERLQGNFTNLHTIINSECKYSAGTFNRGYITDDNYLQEQNLFIIDVDDGLAIAEAKELFSDWTYLITTTKNHQKAKNGTGEICDRFRIILPTVSTFHLESSVYRAMYTNLLDTLNISYDSSCKNASRWYYGNPEGEHWYNEGELLDIRPFIPDSVENKSAQESYNNYDNSNEEYQTDQRIDGAIRWFLRNTSEGSRNNMLFRLGAMLKDPRKIGTPNWYQIVEHVNSCLSKPLTQTDLKAIMRSIDRRIS